MVLHKADFGLRLVLYYNGGLVGCLGTYVLGYGMMYQSNKVDSAISFIVKSQRSIA